MKKLNLLAMALLTCSIGLSQTYQEMVVDPSSNVKQTILTGETYFSTSGSSLAEEKEQKKFLRWKEFAYSHQDENGELQGALDAVNALCNGAEQICSSSHTWKHLGPITGRNSTAGWAQGVGRVRSVSSIPGSPNPTYLAGSSTGGLFKSTDLGSTWTNITDHEGVPGMGIEVIAVNPFDENKILLGTFMDSGYEKYGMGLLMTTNQGSDWVANLDPIFSIKKKVSNIKYHKHNSGEVFLTMENSVYRSLDGGSNWILFHTTPDNNPILHMKLAYPNGASNDYVMYLSTSVKLGSSASAKVWRFDSQNSQLGFVDVTPPPSFSGTSTEPFFYSIANTNAEVNSLYVGTRVDEDTYGLWKSLDKGSTFTNALFAEQTTPNNYFSPIAGVVPGWSSLVVSPTDPDVIYSGGYKVSKISDFSTNPTWSLVNAGDGIHVDIHSIEFISGSPWGSSGGTQDHLIIGHDGGVSHTTNGGSNMSRINGEGLDIFEIYGMSSSKLNTDHILIGAQDNHSASFKPFGSTYQWTTLGGGDGGDPLHLDVYNDENFFLYTNSSGSGFSIYLNRPGGSSFMASGALDVMTPMAQHPTQKKFYYRNFNKLVEVEIIETGSNPVNYSSTSTVLATETGRIQDLAVSPSNPGVLYYALTATDNTLPTSDIIFRFDPNSNTWDDIGEGLVAQWGRNVESITPHPTNEDQAYITLSGASLNTPANTHKVFLYDHSKTPASARWTQFAQGIEGFQFPVNGLAIQEASPENILYLATDNGVYYRYDNPNSIWECMTGNLSPGRYTDIEVNTCRKKLIASSYGRGIWETELITPTNTTVSTETVITGNISWIGQEDRINDNIRVTTGSYFEIINSDLIMGPGTKIIVEPGAHLRVSNSILGCNCAQLWEGIEAHGNKTLPQTAVNQGKVTIENGSIIQNAKHGIVNWKHNDYTSMGGIIECSNSTFKNNWRSIGFNSYQNTNGSGGFLDDVSFVVDCDFILDRTLLNEVDPYTFISMWAVTGVTLEGNHFTGYDVPEVGHRGKYGIHSIDAIYTVKPSSARTSLFKHVTNGVYAEATNRARNVKIKDSDFQNIWRPVSVVGMEFAEVTNNTMTLRDDANHIGIYTYYCSKYQISGNDITGPQASPFSGAGIYISNSGNDINEVIDNNLTLCVNGVIAHEVNDGSGGQDGLDIRCNRNFLVPNFDLAVIDRRTVDAQIAVPGNISLDQGACLSEQEAANNTFGNCANVAGKNFYVDKWSQQNINYHHLGGDQPLCYNILVVPNYCQGLVGTSNKCDKAWSNDFSILTNEFDDHTTGFVILIAKLPGTGDVNNAISGILNDDSESNVLQDLAVWNPFWSDDVLTAAISQKPTPLSDAGLLSVLYQHSPLSPNLMTELALRSQALADDVTNYIATNNLTSSPLTILNREINWTKRQRQLIVDHAVRLALDESNKSAAFNWLDKIPELGNLKSKLFVAERFGDQPMVNTMDLDIRDGADPETITWIDTEMALVALRSLEKGVFDLGTQPWIETELVSVAADVLSYRQHLAAKQAIESWVWGTGYNLPEDFPLVESSKKIDSSEEESTIASEEKFVLFPNPAQNYLSLNWQIKNHKEGGTLYCFDLQGREIHRWNFNNIFGLHQVDISMIPNGSYIFAAHSKDKFKTQKIVILK